MSAKTLAVGSSNAPQFPKLESELAKLSLTSESFIPLAGGSGAGQRTAQARGLGVVDFTALFRRAIGLHMVFAEPAPVECLNGEFLRRHHRYMDQWFELRMMQNTGVRWNEEEFTDDLYASGEYANMLEQTWH